MNVLFLTHRLPYAPNRGDRIRAWHMLHALARRHEITLISLAHDAAETRHAADLASVTRETIVARVPKRANLLRSGLALPTGLPLTHVLLHSRDIQPALERIVTDRAPDVVLAYCSSMARYALERPLEGLPLVIDMVDADSAKWDALAKVSRWPLSWLYGREARCLARFEALAMTRAHATLVVNEREREALAEVCRRFGGAREPRYGRTEGYGGAKAPPYTRTGRRHGGAKAPYTGQLGHGERADPRIEVVPNGIDVATFAPTGPPAEQPSVVFCGVMDYAPNETGAVWLAREVWPRVRQAEPRATLTIVGARPTARVQALATADASVTVTGAVDDVRPYLWSGAVAAAPLHTARGIQNKVLEAVAAGLPAVVTTAVQAGLPAGVLPACRTADAPADFADAIVALLRTTATERRTLARSANLAGLTWEACLAPLEGILEEAARRKR